MAKKPLKPKPFKDWHACLACNLKMGAIIPKGERAITAGPGTCPYCKRRDVMLIPHRDYDWPSRGEIAWFD